MAFCPSFLGDLLNRVDDRMRCDEEGLPDLDSRRGDWIGERKKDAGRTTIPTPISAERHTVTDYLGM